MVIMLPLMMTTVSVNAQRSIRRSGFWWWSADLPFPGCLAFLAVGLVEGDTSEKGYGAELGVPSR